MANTLMFEVGIKSAQEQLEKIKQEFTQANKDLSKLLNIKVSIDGVDAVVKALSQIGDASALRSLRNEIAALNREFSILSKGAGGSGDIAGRGLAADIERTSQSIDRYTNKIKQLTEERTRLVGGTRNSSYQNYTDEILRYEQSLEGAKKKLAELNEQKNKPATGDSLKNATQQETESMKLLKQQVVDLTDKVRILQTALSKSSGAPIASPININLSAIEPTIKTLNEAVNQLKKSMDLLWEATNRMESSMKSIGGIEALEKIKTEAESTKQQVDNLARSVAGMSTQAEKKGSESVLADNLQKLKSRISEVKTEYGRLNESYGQAKTMGMPMNDAIEQRLYNLRRLITMMEQLAQAAQTAGSAEAEALSKSKAFSFVKFDGNQLFSKDVSKLFNKKEIDGYIKTIEEFVKANGHMAQTSGSARSASANLTQMSEAMRESAERANQMGHSFANTVAGMQNFARNIETARLAYDKTLRGISELESRISAGQKANMDRESLDFMNGLKQRAQQWADVLRKLLGENMQGNPMYREFLSMNGNILTSPQIGNMFQSLLGADWKILMKDIGETFNMLMKFSGFSKSLTLDNSTLANWLKGEEAVRRLDNALKDLNRQWAATNNEAKTPDLTAKYEAQKRAIESLIAQIKGAMTEADRMSNRNGLSDLLGVSFKNAVGYDNTRLIQEMRAKSSAVEKEEKEITRQIEREDKERQRIYEKSEKERQALIEQTAKRIRDIEASITRGKASGRDMSALETSLSLMRGQSSLLGKTMPDDSAFKKRMNDLKVLIADTEMLRKAEDKLTAAQERNNKSKLKSDNKALKDEIKSVNDAWIKYNEFSAKLKELEALRDRGIKANIDVSQIDNAIAKYQDLIRVMGEIINNGGRTSKGNLTSELLGGAPAKKMILDANTEVKSYTKSLAEAEKRMNNAATAAGNLDRKIQDIEARRVDFRGMDTSRLDAGLTQLRNIRNELENFSKTGLSAWGNNAGEIAKKMGLAGANKEIKDSLSQLNGQLRQNERDAKNAANATNQLSDAEQRLAHAIKGSSDAMKSQTNILSDLKMMATQYLGVWGAQQFVHNIIQIGGQLEQQRLSIGAILGDMSAGQHLFDQIKDLALTSPFGVMELDKDTKQLSAYGFKQSELFDMTKRLADISAGAGTEVSRLALALGHVRSEGALTGYTLRQFAMNNIPMLQKLSERLTKIEGQIVSTSEIRKRVSKKEIGYEDVIAVIKDLTNEGGMFFNMQETMAEAVNAKFKNLKDSMDIMYGEMAEGGIGSALKKVAESLMFLTRNWEETARVVGYGTAAFVAYRVAVSAANTQMLTYGSTLGATTKTLNAKAIALGINSAAVKRLTADEVDQMVALKLVTREQLLNAVATKTLTVDQAELAAATFGVTRTELLSVASKGKLGIAATGLGLRLKSLALSIRGVGVALKTMLLNPVGIALMALTGGFEVFMRWKQKNEEIEKSIEQLGKKGSEGYKNLSATLEKFTGKDQKMSESEYSTAISEIIDSLKNYAPNITNILKEAQSIDSLAERYKYLREELESTKNAYAELERTKAFASNANEATGNMFNDTFTENVKEYIENAKKVDKEEQELLQHRIALEKTLDEFEKKYAFKRRTDTNGNVLPLIEQLKYIRNTDWNKVFAPMLMSNSQGGASAFADYSVALRKMEERMENEVMPDLQNFANRLNNQYAGTFGKNWKENADHIKTAWMAIVSEIEKVPGMTESVKKDLLEKIFNDTWHLNIDFSTGEVEEELTGWRKEMQNWLDENDLKISIGFNDTPEDIYKKAKTVQEQAQTEMDNAGKVLIGIGFKLDNLPSELPAPLKTPWNQMNFERYPESKKVNDTIEEFKKKFHANFETKQDKAKNKKSGKDPNTERAKAVREQVRIIKEAADAFQYWRDKVGDKGAWAHVQSEFGEVLQNIGITAKNIEDVRGHLKKIPEMKEYKAITDEKIKNEIDKEIAKDNDQFIRKDFERDTERFLSKTQIELDNLTRSWETFNSVREATGNIDLAIQLSGAEYETGRTRNLADAIKEEIQRDFAAAGAVEIPFDVNLSDKEIEESIKKAVPKESEEQIKGLVEEYKKWRDLQRDVLKSDINTFAKLAGAAVDYKTRVRQINDELERQIEELNEVAKRYPELQGDIDNAKQIATVKAVEEAWKTTESYAALYNSSLSMTRDELQNGVNVAVAILQEKMRLNLITAHDYAQEMEKIRKIMREFDSNGLFGKDNGLTSFLQGGVQGLNAYYDRMIERYTRLADQAKNSGRPDDWANYMNTAATFEQAQKKLASFTNSIASATLVVDMAKGVLDGFQKAAQSLSDMFDALGKSGAAEDWSDIADTIGAVASSLNGASSVLQNAMNGNIGGTISSVLSAPVETITAPITAFAQLHDKKRERQIEDLKREVSKIDNTLNLIKSLRERELGYDSGNLRRQLAAQYKSQIETFELFGQQFTKNTAANAMYEYYSRGGLDGSGYQQELEALKEQRKLYEEMYVTEQDKKKSSSEALEEYKQKMAELDLTIMNYAKDLASELYGIDLKGWADQIGDSLMTAFENGEDAAEAFKDTVQDIMRQVLRKMLNLGIIERMMGRLQTKIFGENGEGGSFDINNPEGTIDAAMRDVAEFFGENGDGQKMIEATQTFYNKWEEFMRSQGMTLSDEGSSSGTSSSIKGITEQTADLLASYLNATRASTSNIENLSAQYFPLFYSSITSSNASLVNIQQNTAAIMRSNDAIERSNQAILENINGLKNKTWKVPMA